ncbi:MAG: adenosylcobinamide amidohydrolase, partial [Desulfococcaceae bacterium]
MPRISPFPRPRVSPSLLLLALLLPAIAWAGELETPVSFRGANGETVALERRPSRVVCLAPAVTDLVFAAGGGDAVVGVTYADEWPPEAAEKPVVGGFRAPSIDAIRDARPDLIILSPGLETRRSGEGKTARNPHPFSASPLSGCEVIQPKLDSLADLYDLLARLGRLFGDGSGAERLIAEIRGEIDRVDRRLAPIPPEARKRVVWFAGGDPVRTAGDDAFPAELIRLAGGIPLSTGKTGRAVPLDLAQWQAFQPEFVAGRKSDKAAMKALLGRPEWKDAPAAKRSAIAVFPDFLLGPPSAGTGGLVSALAQRLYGREFEENGPVNPERIIRRKPAALELPGVASAEIVFSELHDAVHKTLLVHLARPMRVASTLEGPRDGILHVGNGYSPPEVWELYHRIGLDVSRRQLLAVLGLDAADTSLLFTGADMDRLSVQTRSFQEMTVAALVTAGVRSNALRMSRDRGDYYEPGTINMILMANMKLSPRAMNRAIIAATEAKTAALWDMDIRSAYTGAVNPATGTGTDNIIVVEGEGTAIENAGGHAKMGELIARAVHAGVQEAVFRQNGLTPQRPVYRRLSERGLSLTDLPADAPEAREWIPALEALLLKPRYAGFLESALAVSDHRERGLVSDGAAFETWCGQIAREIAGGPIPKTARIVLSGDAPPVLKLAIEALLSG